MLKNRFARSGFFNADDGSGHSLFYEDYGPEEGQPFIIVHGNGGALCDLSRLPFDLSRQRVIQLHARGVGNSMPPGAINNNLYPDWARDIEQLRQKLKLDKVNLCGWSGGTAVALLYAQEHPEHTAGLVLAGTYLAKPEEVAGYYRRVAQIYPEGWAEFTKRYGDADPVGAFNRAVTDAETVEERVKCTRHYEMIFERGESKKDRKKSLDERHGRQDWIKKAAARRVYANMMLHDCGLEPGKIEAGMKKIESIPVLYVNGTLDHITPRAVAAALAKTTTQSLQILVDGAGHDIHDKRIQEALRGPLKNFPDYIRPFFKPVPPSSPLPR